MLFARQIKPILVMFGINNLSVKFEPESRQIRTEFDRGDEHCEEIITFEQIEDIFTDTARPPAAARGDERIRTG